jgi:histidine triad (HIT) family protein
MGWGQYRRPFTEPHPHAAPDGCVFCDYDDEDRIRFRWSDALVIDPIGPVTRGHVLIVPKVHVRTARDDILTTATVFGRAADWSQRQAYEPFNLITSAGEPATQTVMHLHVHYVPREVGDGLPLPWAPG